MTTMKPMMQSREFGISTHMGRTRQVYDDCYSILTLPWATLILIADGRGMHPSGSTIARIAIETVLSFFTSSGNEFFSPEYLVEAFKTADSAILWAQEQNETLADATCALTGVILTDGNRYHVCHVGDCRAYQIREGRAFQLTVDHLMTSELTSAGVDLNMEQGTWAPPTRELLTRALGGGETNELKVDLKDNLVLNKGERLILCTSGLYRLVSEREIGSIASSSCPAESCRRLESLALERGGTDNITVIIIDG